MSVKGTLSGACEQTPLNRLDSSAVKRSDQSDNVTVFPLPHLSFPAPLVLAMFLNYMMSNSDLTEKQNRNKLNKSYVYNCNQDS